MAEKRAEDIKADGAKGKSSITRGGRNLVILGVGSIGVALLATTISLFLYHNSGDIYLDRSRPGYLPDDKEEVKSNEVQGNNYQFSDTGEIDKTTLEEYRKELEFVTREVKKVEKPYSAEALSDESLGIVEEK